jgi:hypothetical protein
MGFLLVFEDTGVFPIKTIVSSPDYTIFRGK